MADHLVNFLISTLKRVFACLLMVSLSAVAESLPDPTRPPQIIFKPIEEAVIAKPKVPVLQSVLLSRTRSAAIIDGQIIELGGKFGDVRLIEINDVGVILLGAKGRQFMSLYPGVDMSIKSIKAGP